MSGSHGGALAMRGGPRGRGRGRRQDPRDLGDVGAVGTRALRGEVRRRRDPRDSGTREPSGPACCSPAAERWWWGALQREEQGASAGVEQGMVGATEIRAVQGTAGRRRSSGGLCTGSRCAVGFGGAALAIEHESSMVPLVWIICTASGQSNVQQRTSYQSHCNFIGTDV
jgi:hypothetical protein